MGAWGRGLLQSDDDYDIAGELSGMFECNIFQPEEEEQAEIVKKLESGLLSRKFDKLLSASFKPQFPYHSRDRMVVILGMLAMQLGATIDGQYMAALRILRYSLPNLFQQLQLLTALDEYRSGTPWILESKGLMETLASAGHKTEYDNGDEFWASGLGHPSDEDPYPHTHSKRCLACGNDEEKLLHCGRCKMARYCNRSCQKTDWIRHQSVCEPLEARSVRVPKICSEVFTECKEAEAISGV